MDTKRGNEFRCQYTRYEELASAHNEKLVESQKEKIMEAKNAEAKRVDQKVFKLKRINKLFHSQRSVILIN